MRSLAYDEWTDKMKEAGGYVEIDVRKVQRQGKRNRHGGSITYRTPLGKNADQVYEKAAAFIASQFRKKSA